MSDESFFPLAMRSDAVVFSVDCILPHTLCHLSKELPSRFHLNGHTLGFNPQTQKLEPPFTA